MAVTLSSLAGAGAQFFDNNGVPLAGGLIYTYLAGTSTPSATYTSSTGLIAHANPIVLDAAGRIATGEVWLTSGVEYKFVVKTALFVQIGSYDNIPSINDFTSIYAALANTTSANLGDALIGFKQSNVSGLLSGAVGRTVHQKLQEFVSVLDFGAVADGVTDSIAAFQAAALAAKCVYVPTGSYLISGTVSISKNGAQWYGDGISSTIITSNSTTLPMFSIATGLNGVQIENLQLTRSVVATNGADGIRCSTVTIGQAQLSRLLVQKQWVGINLGPTDYSEVKNCIVQKCLSEGFRVVNTATDGACQWSFDSCLSQMNDARGFLTQTIAGPAQVTLGTYKNCATYANSITGIAFAGSASVPIQGVRIIGGFYGESGNSNVYLDTYGDQHMITAVFTELAGQIATGSASSTPPSGIGSGIEVTSNNFGTLITGCHSNGNSEDGFYLSGVTTTINGCRATNNGLQLIVGKRNGVSNVGGTAIISGCRIGNTGSGTSQLYGISCVDGNNIAAVGNDLRSNTTAAFNATANATFLSKIANLPNTLDVQLSPAGAVVVNGTAVGGASIVGGINVAAGLEKNNVAYTNP